MQNRVLVFLHCTVPYFGFKAKRRMSNTAATGIVLCLILDSRQNLTPAECETYGLYCALFWIQGKTCRAQMSGICVLYCALFWIQGKTIIAYGIKKDILYCALFWIQGKTKPEVLKVSD